MKAVCALFVLQILSLVTPAGGQPKAPLRCSIKCPQFTSQIAAQRIRSYRRTEPLCTKQAVVLITLKSKELCADPKAEWVKKIVEGLDQKKAAASSLPSGATSVAAESGVFGKQIGLAVTAPSQATAPAHFFPGTSTTVLESMHVPAAGTEVSSESPPAMPVTTQLPVGSSATSGAGRVSSQPTPYPSALVHGLDSTTGPMEEPVGHTRHALADVQATTPPASTSDPTATSEGSDHPVLSANESPDPTSARANAPNASPSSFSSDLPSILDSMEITTVPASPVPPDTTSVSSLNSTSTVDKGPAVHTNKALGSFQDTFSARTFDYSLPAGKQEPSDRFIFTEQTFLGQAGAQVAKEGPDNQPLPTFLSRPPMPFVIPVAVVGGLMACSVAVAWLYLKFAVKPEDMSREMVQGLLYQKGSHDSDICPMEVV